MEARIIKDEKENLVVELDNQTIAELMRVYLNKDSAVQFAAWKREHPEKPVILEIKTKDKTARKALDDAVKSVEKEAGRYMEEFKKAK